MRRRRFELGDRGRVPFALVGVLLLVTSAMFTGAVDTTRSTPEPAVDAVVERTTADARTAFRTAVSDASAASAASPVISPASTRWGDVVSGPSAFRDALRIRIYVTARERFEAVGHRRNAVTGDVSLADTPTPDALRKAKRRVSIERAGDEGAKLRAEISNVSVTATEGERVVGKENVSFSVVVPSPVLATHDRVETYESRLDADLPDEGLTRALSARLWALAWGRGYAQYGGAPISNVVSNRHVEIMANGALLDLQESTFGRSDPDGGEALRTATVATGARDLTSPIGSLPASTSKLFEEQLRLASKPTADESIPRITTAGSDAGDHSVSRPDRAVNVSVGISADAAFLALAEGSSSNPGPRSTDVKPAVNETIQNVYSARVGLVAEAVNRSTVAVPDPGDDADVRDRTYVDSRVVNVARAPTGPSVGNPAGTHRLETYDRTVTVEHVWRFGVAGENGTEFVTRNATQERRVRVALVGRHALTDYAPDRPIEHVHDRGGRFGGWNLANVTDRAKEDVVEARGGPAELARKAATGDSASYDIRESPAAGETIEADWSDEVWRWIYRDLGAFRERLRNESVAVPQGELGTYQATPARRLTERLAANASRLKAVPDTYDGVAEKARVAVRGWYFDEVLKALESRARRRAGTKSEIEDRFASDGAPVSFDVIRDAYDASRANRSDGERGGPLEFRVDGAPPYLTTMELGSDDLPSIEGDETVYPLAAQNVNHATVPYASVADSLLSSLLGGPPEPKTKLETAGQALRAANRTAGDASQLTFRENRTELTAEIRTTIRGRARRGGSDPHVGGIASGLALILDDYGVDSPRERVVGVLERWPTVDARAMAIGNGSVVDPLVTVADRHDDGELDSAVARDELGSTLRGYLRDELESDGSKVRAAAVTAVSEELKSKVGERINETAVTAADRRFGKSVSRVPAGIPIAPIPGAWVVTANTWSVKVRGEYHRFAVETARRTAAAGDPSLTYVRDGGNVTLDVDEDGDRELLGTADRVSFEAATGVAVVVPAGRAGVGDVNGQMIENSEGWPHAGPTSERPESCLSRLEAADISSIERREIAREKPGSVDWAYYCRNQLANASVLDEEE